MVVGSPFLAETVERLGYRFWPGHAPPEDELDEVWRRATAGSYEERGKLVVGGIFAGLNVRAMLPSLCRVCGEWKPDLLLRETAEYASAIAGEVHGIPHARIGVSLAAQEERLLSLAGPVLEERHPGIVERIRTSPYVTPFPASLEELRAGQPAVTYRYRDPGPARSPEPLPDWWSNGEDPLVYASFGSATGTLPNAAAIYAAALEAVTELPARVLLTIGLETDADAVGAGPANVHVARWVPQADVFPHASVVVCHGGSGTTLGALASGLPLVVVPLFADQPANARRVAAVGAGIVVGPDDEAQANFGEGFGAAELRRAIAAVLANSRYREAAGAIADEMRALPPPAAVLTAIIENAAIGDEPPSTASRA